jgi:hypothetical protein
LRQRRAISCAEVTVKKQGTSCPPRELSSLASDHPISSDIQKKAEVYLTLEISSPDIEG